MRPAGVRVLSCSDHARQARVRRGSGDAAALGHGLAVDLLDVSGEGERRRGADRHPDAIGMDGALGGLETADPLRIEPAGHEYADGVEPGPVAPGADLFDQV